jgi:hypothetical protein
MNQYFDNTDFISFLEEIKLDMDKVNVELAQTDTYNESVLMETIKTKNPKILMAIALQLAIVGYGQKTFGFVNIDGEKIEIKEYFDKNGIEYSKGLSDKVGPEIITPRRLIRFFRFATLNFLEKNENVYPYLYKKYAIDRHVDHRLRIFNGFEHIINPDDTDNARILLRTYLNMDKRNRTNVSERIKRVLMARGFGFEFLESITL